MVRIEHGQREGLVEDGEVRALDPFPRLVDVRQPCNGDEYEAAKDVERDGANAEPPGIVMSGVVQLGGAGVGVARGT